MAQVCQSSSSFFPQWNSSLNGNKSPNAEDVKMFCLVLFLSPTAAARVSLSLSSRIPFLLCPCTLCRLIPLGHFPSSVLLLITFPLYPLLSKLPPLFMPLIGRLFARVKLSPAAPRCPSCFSAHSGGLHSVAKRGSFKETEMELGFKSFFCFVFFSFHCFVLCLFVCFQIHFSNLIAIIKMGQAQQFPLKNDDKYR